MQRWQYPAHNDTLETFLWYKLGEFIQCFLFTSHFRKKLQMKINSLKKQKHWYLIYTCSDKAFQREVVYRALPSNKHFAFSPFNHIACFLSNLKYMHPAVSESLWTDFKRYTKVQFCRTILYLKSHTQHDYSHGNCRTCRQL